MPCHRRARRLAAPGGARVASAFAPGLLLAGLLLTAGHARAAPEEIEVYRDDVTATHGWGLEVNQNYVVSGSRQDEASGALGPVHLYRITPELDYGLARNWEVGALVEATVRHDEFDAHGVKAHVRHIAPRPEDNPWYWGFNFEAGFTDKHLDERPMSAELRGIAGYEGRRWIVAVNPTVETSANSQAVDPVSFELQVKVGYRATDKLILGIESYNEFGPVRDFGPLGAQPQMLYATTDYEWRGIDLNVGVGRGLTASSDGWAVKTVIGVPFGRR
jgi:hypothetical protein